jgi:hypothetical protein
MLHSQARLSHPSAWPKLPVPAQERGGAEQKGMALYRVAIYAVMLVSCYVAQATLRFDPGLLYRVTREDGPIEWATVAALILLASQVALQLRQPPAALARPLRWAGWALVALALFAAGEEISWGQRIFGFETGETMQAINLQRETNLHNLIPGPLFNGLIIFALGIGFVVVPTVWRKLGRPQPAWLPGPEVSLLMLDAILINHYRFSSLPEQIGIVVLLLLLVQQTVSALWARSGPLIGGSLLGWLTVLCHYHARSVLRAANHQYEIRELVVVLLAALWAQQTLQAYRAETPPVDPR